MMFVTALVLLVSIEVHFCMPVAKNSVVAFERNAEQLFDRHRVGDGTPADSQENWILAFARAQKDLPNMPRRAKFKDDWQAFITNPNYTFVGKQVPTILKELKGNVEYEHGPWKNINASLPYTRVCVPVCPLMADFDIRSLNSK